ncbi:MAG: hypothetical protein CFH20_00251 [Alphaproteobacteria bacterium MarineAlpha5_Bin10]|nr:MAG: hypothetical protein CFH20_00251 [Alphaproteobacteria bacterium MarineAlpha5_Bin10]|tara:strand:- start:2664 stop:4067 length:1404 start_codon:yes stop_codon:yes gene_type:complete
MEKSIRISFVFLFFFTFFKILSIYFSKIGLSGDEAQYWIWSQNLQSGYFSKPPLLPFIIYFFTNLFGDTAAAIKITSVSIYIATSVNIYLIANNLFNRRIAYYCAIAFYLLPGVSFSSFLVSTDVPLLFFWSLSIYLLLKQISKPSYLLSIIFGIVLAMGFLSKYAMIYFFICTLIYVFFDQRARDYFKNNIFKNLIGLFFFFITILPNIFWNTNNNWLTLRHTADNASLGNVSLSFINFFEFFIAQIFIIGPVLAITGFYYGKKILTKNTSNVFLICYSAPILLIVGAESLMVRAHGNWAAVSYVCLSILIVANIFKSNDRSVVINNFINLFFGLTFFLLILFGNNLKIFDRLGGYENFSKTINVYANDEKINNIVIEERMLFSLVKYNLREYDLDFYCPKSPTEDIGHHFQIDNPLLKNFNNNFLYIGDINRISYLENPSRVFLLNEYSINSKARDVKIHKVIFD